VSTKVGRRLELSQDPADRQDAQGFAVPAALQRVWDFSWDGIRRTLEASLTGRRRRQPADEPC
jgi:D-threo-aldose 1-dehydrogenase